MHDDSNVTLMVEFYWAIFVALTMFRALFFLYIFEMLCAEVFCRDWDARDGCNFAQVIKLYAF